MRRVLVLGSSGSGKSTFATRLSQTAGLPIVSLDALFWQPGWRASDPVSFETRVMEAANEPAWIMDGNYLSQGAGALRRAVADTIFWFDLPRWVCISGVLLRIAKTHGQVRPEMAAGCPEKIDIAFFRYVWTYRQRQRPKQLEFFQGLRSDQTFIRFTRRSEADSYLATNRPSGLATVGA
jgi:adenylate kinase family enzyme